MSIFEYDEEAVLELLEDSGEIPESLSMQICGETNLDTLKRWHKLAAKADSIEQFIAAM